MQAERIGTKKKMGCGVVNGMGAGGVSTLWLGFGG